MVQDGISWSRASAFCINLNSAVILILVCRNFISYFRSFLCCSPNLVRVIDKHVSFHRYVGYLIVFFTIIHTLGHVHNLESFVTARNAKFKPSNSTNENDLLSGLLSTLSLLNKRPNINPVETENAIPIIECLKIVAGVTGILMCLGLSLMVSTSCEYIRRSFYNLFWYLHQSLAAFYIILLSIHGAQKIVKNQINTINHNPQQCYLIYSEWPVNTENRKCDLPEFEGSFPTSWIWILVSVILYLLERFVRFVRGLKKYKLSKFVKHPSNVIELQIENFNRMKYRAGQYVYLNISEISFFEWHPFTLTSAPDDQNLSVHIRCVGDWTTKISKILENENKHLRISIDGPFGSCAEDVFKYQKVVLIGAGIGVTPYASILKHIWYILSTKLHNTAILKKVYFFWICSTIDSFEWFGDLLQNLEQKIKMNNRQDLLEYKIYLTRGWSLRQAKEIAYNNDDDYDLYTGLSQKTNYGRPNFDLFFKEMSNNVESDNKENCGVFFCGPSQLSQELHILCNKYSNKSIKFIYNKESF